MDTVTQSENIMSSTPKETRSSVDRHERKTLQTLQPLVAVTPRRVGKSVSSFSKDSFGVTSTPSSTSILKIYKDTKAPDACSHVHCTRQTQTEDFLLQDLIQEHIRADDFDDSGRVSGYIDDLVNNDEVSETYWKDLAEERRRGLKEALVENERLTIEVEKLREENTRLSEIAQEAEALKELLKDVISDDEEAESPEDTETQIQELDQSAQEPNHNSTSVKDQPDLSTNPMKSDDEGSSS
ncbi:geminin-like isoform X2 [Physella acuta]|uniref:geminin-like isoform X2 n=1 Tax=Physella acuta TaxID=109671 RepID=UPI0027DC9E5B|nr:geminin-like isoform X2 [Physella acuta]